MLLMTQQLPLRMTRVSKPIPMALSHLTEIFILSSHSCLRRSTLAISLSCSVMFSGKRIWTDRARLKDLISPRTGGRRQGSSNTRRPLQPRPIPNQRLMMIPGEYLVTSPSLLRMIMQQPKPFWYPPLQSRPHIPSLKILS